MTFKCVELVKKWVVKGPKTLSTFAGMYYPIMKTGIPCAHFSQGKPTLVIEKTCYHYRDPVHIARNLFSKQVDPCMPPVLLCTGLQCSVWMYDSATKFHASTIFPINEITSSNSQLVCSPVIRCTKRWKSNILLYCCLLVHRWYGRKLDGLGFRFKH